MMEPSAGGNATFTGSSNQGMQVGQISGTVNYYAGGQAGTGKTTNPETIEHELSLPLGLPATTAVETFVGREKELSDIRTAFTNGSEKRSTVVLYGLGGAGKTQLATKYAKDHCKDYLAVIWLKGNDKDSLEQGFTTAAQRLSDEHPNSSTLNDIVRLSKPAETAAAMVRWLGRSSNRRWLLVFDNVDNPKLPSYPDGAYDLEQYIPIPDHGHIIITTRLSELDIGTCIPVRKFEDINESLSVLAATSRRPNALTDPDAADLAKRLDGLPLALSSAGALLRQISLSFAAYLRNYEESWQKVQKMSPANLSYRDRTLRTTWEISLDRVKRINPDAAELLRLWSHFDHHDLWYELIGTGQDAAPELCPLAMEGELDFHEAMKVLQDHSLVELSPDGTGYSCHACVHDWICSMAPGEQDSDIETFCLLSVGLSVPYDHHEKYWVLQRRLIPHANRLPEYSISGRKNYISRTLNAHQSLGDLYQDQDKFEEAEKILKRALSEYEEVLGRDDLSILCIVNSLGLIYKHQDMDKDAEEMFLRALHGFERTLEKDNSNTLSTLNNLGFLYEKQDRLEESLEMYQRSVAGKERTLGPECTSTLETLNNLGIVYRKLGRLEEAEALYERVLTGHEKVTGLDHTSTLGAVYNIAKLYKRLERCDEAETMFKRAIAGFDKILGPDNGTTLTATANLGVLYQEHGLDKKAEILFERALDGYRRGDRLDHRNVRAIKINLARAQDRLKQQELESERG